MKIDEITVNYNHLKNMWVLRKDAVNGKFFKPYGETKSIILQNAEPVIDWDAVDKGQRVFAFVQGDKAVDVPDGYTTRPIKFTRSEQHPFAHVDDNSPFVKADFVTFNEKGAFAHYKDVSEAEKQIGTFEKDYYRPLKPAQKEAIQRALVPEIKMYIADGYNVILRTAKDDDRGTAVLLYIKKEGGMSSLVAHKSMGPNGKLVDKM